MKLEDLPKNLKDIFIFIDVYENIIIDKKFKKQNLYISRDDKLFIKYLFQVNQIDRYFLWKDFYKLVEKQSIEFVKSPMTIAVDLIKRLKK